MLRRIKRWLLKTKARRLYTRYLLQLDAYDCGAALAEYINPALLAMRTEVEAIVAQLKANM